METTATRITINPSKMKVFQYAAFSEQNFKRNMSARGVEIDTTFMSDISIAEWCQVNIASETNGVNDTIERCMKEWITNVHYITQFLMAVNSKSWEHYAMMQDKYAEMRFFTKEQHEEFAKFWSEKYYELLDRVYDYHKDDEKKTAEIYSILD